MSVAESPSSGMGGFKYINHTKTVCQVKERLLSLASCIIYISLIFNELYRENLVKHITFILLGMFLIPFNV